MASLDLLDTPRRTSLTSRSTALRAEIKDWERSFAATHDGKKPSKGDIKVCSDIAAKYKEFQKLGDVLSGKLSVEVLQSPRKKQATDPVRRRLYDATPRKSKSSRLDVHPNEIDPYDVPPSTTPKRFLSAIGPTPQRDGKVLGLLDLLSNPGGSRASQNTPDGQERKRKIDVLIELDGNVIAQTPSRKKIALSNDILDHLTAGDERDTDEVKKFGRTPVSESKKFMLSQFFATPSTMRYASLVEEVNTAVERTPLRNHVLGPQSAEKKSEQSADLLDTTPVFLRRSHSFKERLTSAKPGVQPTSPSVIRRVPPALRTYISTAKTLALVVQDLEVAPAEASRPALEDDDEDAMEAMREMEDDVQADQTQKQVLSDFEGQGESDLEGSRPLVEKEKVWKKKGQKRTTKRSDMKPAMVKKSRAPKFVAPEDSNDEISRIEETQLHTSNVDANFKGMMDSPYEDLSDDELQAIGELADSNLKDSDDSQPEPIKTKRRSQSSTPTHNERDETPSHAFKPKKRSKAATINPNALSHQNFKSLKIRNRNSKAGGGGGMGRRGGRFGARKR